MDVNPFLDPRHELRSVRTCLANHPDTGFRSSLAPSPLGGVSLDPGRTDRRPGDLVSTPRTSPHQPSQVPGTPWVPRLGISSKRDRRLFHLYPWITDERTHKGIPVGYDPRPKNEKTPYRQWDGDLHPTGTRGTRTSTPAPGNGTTSSFVRTSVTRSGTRLTDPRPDATYWNSSEALELVRGTDTE